MIKKIKAWSTSKKALVIAVATGMLYGICVFIARYGKGSNRKKQIQ